MIGRRDLIKFGAGGAVGTALTPLPWKLLDDSAIWSQNWSWIPKVPRGEITVKYSTCTLCPGGCGVRARCAGGRAFSVEPVGDHPLSRGVLCPVGFGAHAAAYHPQRITRPRGDVSRIARALERSPFAILDLGPRRAMSSLYAEAAAARNGQYLRMPDRDEAFLDALAAILGRPPGSIGIDLEHTRTLISFGAPVLESWATPGRVLNRWRTKDLKLVQIEPRQSRSALAADRWIVESSALTDFSSAEMPAAVVGHGDPEMLARLNIAVGAIGREGGIVSRRFEPWPRPAAVDLDRVADRSLPVLFIDASRAYDVVPWPLIQRKLAGGALVVAFPYKEDALTRHADIVLPVAAPFEAAEDVTTPPCSAVAAYLTAPPLIAAPAVRETPADHLNAIAGTSLASVEDTIKQRVAKLQELKRGTITNIGETVVWMDEADRSRLSVKNVKAGYQPSPSAAMGLTLMVHGIRAGGATPFETKLDVESGLYAPASLARINPETARDLRLENGLKAILETRFGSAARRVLIDPAVKPGVIEVAASPADGDITDICTDGSGGEWRSVAVSVRRS